MYYNTKIIFYGLHCRADTNTVIYLYLSVHWMALYFTNMDASAIHWLTLYKLRGSTFLLCWDRQSQTYLPHGNCVATESTQPHSDCRESKNQLVGRHTDWLLVSRTDEHLSTDLSPTFREKSPRVDAAFEHLSPWLDVPPRGQWMDYRRRVRSVR